MKELAVITVLMAIVNALAFRPEVGATPTFWALVSIPVVLLACYSAFRLHRAGRLQELVQPKAGDLTLGAAVGGLLLLASWAGRTLLAGWGTERQAWLLSVYLQVGDPDVIQSSVLMTLLLLLVVLAEEVVFRGWVQELADTHLGRRRGWMVATCIYAVCLAPTVFTLAAPGVGPNPLLFLAAALCGLCWGLVRRLGGRLLPIVVSHGIFTYFSIVQFRLPGL